jgi:hypothetical protein
LITDDLHAVTGLGQELGGRLVAFRAGDALEVELDRRFDIAVAHVEAIADPGHGLALDRAAVFEEGLHVGQQLARVRLVGQAVDHRHARVGGEFGQGAVGVGTDHHRIEHARHDDGAVADRLATAQLGVTGRQEDRLAAELDHAGLERHAGAGRGFLEDHPSTRFFKGSNSTPRLRRSFSSMPRRITLSNSSGVQSSRERKCLALIIDYLFATDRRSKALFL